MFPIYMNKMPLDKHFLYLNFRFWGCLCSVFPAGGFFALSEDFSFAGAASASCSFLPSFIFRSSSLTDGFPALVIVAPSAGFLCCSEVGSDRGDFSVFANEGFEAFSSFWRGFPIKASISLSFSAFSCTPTSGSG